MINCNQIQTIENINNILKYVEFAIAILLIISLIIDYINYVNNKLMVSKKIYYKLLIALLVIVIPNGVFYVIKETNNNSCKEIITPVEKPKEEEKNNDDVYINNVKDKISKLNNELNDEYYNDAIENLNNIKNEEVKNNLKEELNNLKKYLDYKNSLDKLKNNYNNQEYYDLYLEIEESENENLKKYLLNYISTLGFNMVLNIQSGIHLNKSGSISYYEGIPKHPTENMPLVIFMQANDCHLSFFRNSSAYTDQEFFFLAPDVGPYNDDLLKSFKSIIDNTILRYRINKNKIIITGHSNGALSTLKLVSFFPNYFAVAVPISSTLPNFSAKAYSNTAFWGICGTGESCATTMQEYAASINKNGGNAKSSTVRGGHNDAACAFIDKNLLKWVFAQEKK